MERCRVCNQGTFREQLIEKWIQQDSRWVLTRGVLASRCDMCGETTFSQEVADRLTRIATPDSGESPTELQWFKVYDLRAPTRPANGTGPESRTFTEVRTNTSFIEPPPVASMLVTNAEPALSH